ncbi:MAG: permease, partial [Planctomycetota bacterium]
MQYLVASLLVLIVGPIAYRVVRTNDRWLSLLDGFNFTAIAGLVLFSILPEALGHGGAWAIAFCAAGMFVPTFVERNFHRAGRESHFAALGLAMLGLAAHAIVDGAALSHAATEGIQSVVQDQLDHAKHSHLPFGIILHRLPVGLTIWLLLRPKYGILAASSVLGLVAASTLCGYFAGPILLGDLSDTARAYFDALVAGSLMHVVVHRPHVESGSCSGHASSPSWMEGAGGAMGIGLLAALAIGGELLSSELGHEIERAFVDLALASAPALLLGFLVAGLLHSFWPKESVAWMRRGSGFTQSVKGVAVGLPMPVCSCGVVPIYRTLIERGAPTTAALAF